MLLSVYALNFIAHVILMFTSFEFQTLKQTIKADVAKPKYLTRYATQISYLGILAISINIPFKYLLYLLKNI